MARKPAKPKTAAQKKKDAAKEAEAAKTVEAATTPEVEAAPENTPKPKEKPTYSPAFIRSCGFIMSDKVEGGYVNDPRDPGGETKYGISKRSYPKVNIAELTLEEATEITHRDFWLKMRCDEMPEAIAAVTLDCGFNQGPSIAGRLLQKALRNVTVDGVIGPQTIAAVNAHGHPTELAISFIGWRLRRYAFTANANTYMRGWSIRVLRLTTHLAASEAITLPAVAVAP